MRDYQRRLPVYADGDQVKYGSRAAGDVDGNIEVTECFAQLPVHVDLRKYKKERGGKRGPNER